MADPGLCGELHIDCVLLHAGQAVEDMDGAKFSKLCKDVKLTGKGLSPTDVDLIFVKVRARGERRITFEQVGLKMAEMTMPGYGSYNKYSWNSLGVCSPWSFFLMAATGNQQGTVAERAAAGAGRAWGRVCML
jgi:hypothetical protein